MGRGGALRHLAALTTTQATARAAAAHVLVVPVGSCEQHGPHLPLTTDTDIAVALADALVARRSDVLAAPAVAYGSSGEHAGFAGTLSIGQEAVELLLTELGRSATATFARVLLVSAHGGNAAPVGRAVRLLRAEGRDVRAWAPRLAGDAHAGHTETSLLLHLAPERVRMPAAVPGDLRPLADILPRLQADGVRAVSPNGVLGDPTAASAADGGRLFATALADLDALIAGWPATTVEADR